MLGRGGVTRLSFSSARNKYRRCGRSEVETVSLRSMKPAAAVLELSMCSCSGASPQDNDANDETDLEPLAPYISEGLPTFVQDARERDCNQNYTSRAFAQFSSYVDPGNPRSCV